VSARASAIVIGAILKRLLALIALPLAAVAQSTPDARSPDYSDGIDHVDHMPGMDMLDHAAVGMLMIDQLEFTHGDDSSGQRWEVQGRYGNDLDKLWLRSEGEHEDGRLEHADMEALWSHAVAPYWDTQLGVRHDFGTGPARDWVAFGIEGLAPYFFETQATFYVGSSGRTAARLRTDYDVLITQRLILQPEFEANIHGKSDPRRDIGAGLSQVDIGLRLRYEIRREFAPYIGIVWRRRFGQTADFMRDAGQSPFDAQVVAGLRIWF
jgi:copper resistance protein B